MVRGHARPLIPFITWRFDQVYPVSVSGGAVAFLSGTFVGTVEDF